MIKRVLVTGANRGIGKAIAECLIKNNFSVTLHARKETPESATTFTDCCTLGKCSNIFFDVTNRQEARNAITTDIEKNGPYWEVITNAGITRDGPFAGFSDADWDDVINTSLNGFYNTVHPLLMPMLSLKSGGRIIAISSYSGIIGNRGQANYSAAKAGLIAACKSLSKELGKRKITVNSVAPGFIETSMTENPNLTEVIKQIPIPRMGRPEEVASLVNFLLSDDAGYITGQVISINGGLG